MMTRSTPRNLFGHEDSHRSNRSDTQKELRSKHYVPVTFTTCTHKATLQKGKIELERLPPSNQKSSRSSVNDSTVNVFPDKSYSVADITCAGLTPEFLVYGNTSGSIFYFSIKDETPLPVTEYRHVDCGISRIWLNSCGSRLIFEDDNQRVHIYNPLDDQVLVIPRFTGLLEGAIWDKSDSKLFLLVENSQNFVYLYSQINIRGPTVTFLGASARPTGYKAISLDKGMLQCKLESGETKVLILPTHQWKHKGAKGNEELMERFKESLSLLHFKEAWTDAYVLKSTDVWDKFTQKALEQLEVEIAIKACQQSKNFKMLPYLHSIEEVENRSLLAGHIFLLFGDHDAAQDAFLKSSCPEAALEMRSNLQQWDKALALAIELGTSSTTEVKIEYAQLLERRGEHRNALLQYDNLLKEELNPAELLLVRAGIARTSIYCGDPWKGRQMALHCDDRSLYIGCALIFESLKLFEDAADFFELGGQFEKSVSCYIATKNFSKAVPLLERLSSPKFYVEFAKAMEAEGNFADAAVAFESAKDYSNVVRLYLGPLQNPPKAYSIVRMTKSVSGAVLAAKFCKTTGDYAKAIEFLILSRRSHEAKELAELHNKMDVYTELVVDFASDDECLQLARYYETMGEYGKAGTLLERCGQSDKALKLYLCWGNDAGVEKAIDLVGRSRNEALSSQLFEYLKTKEGAQAKSIHLYKLHKSLGDFDEAGKLVCLLADEEQEKGNYKRAHTALLDFCLTLRAQGKEMFTDILNRLVLLHSYVLGKIHIRLGDHSAGSWLLIRVARNIEKFPAHVVPILTSTVIECDRSGLKSTAFEFASVLMRPEYRNLIAAAYKRKVEKIVRKCEKGEEKEPRTPCPFCSALVPNMKLNCDNCNSAIPFCIASGRHMVLGDWSACHHCKFPALATELIKVIESNSLCPMCNQKLDRADIICLERPLSHGKA